MIDLKAKVGAAGEYSLQVRRRGHVVASTGWFDNLLLDQGLNNMAGPGAFNCCQVGTGTAAPAETQTALISRVAGVVTGSVGSFIDIPARQWVTLWTYTFPAGTATGNITEAGTGTAVSGSTLSSRALIRDAGGNPVAITVTPEDDLVVQYQLRLNQPVADFASSGATIRAARVNNVNVSDQLDNWGVGMSGFQLLSGRAYIGGSLGTIEQGVTGGSSASTVVVSEAPYVPGSFSRAASFTLGATQVNGAVNAFQWRFGPTLWQCLLDTPVNKVSPQTMRVSVSITWGRA